MTFHPKYYLDRAIELEAMANDNSESRVRSGLLELARSFREMANVASISQADAKTQSFAVGRYSGPH
jgi:hypothetical protein